MLTNPSRAAAAAAAALGLCITFAATGANAAGPCFATSDDGATVFDSADASAVQSAIAAGSAGKTVKIAGTCYGTQLFAGDVQSAYVPYAATLEGGYPPAGPGAASWTQPPDFDANPTILDAGGTGRVIRSIWPLVVRGLTIQNGIDAGGGYGGAGIFTFDSLTLERVTLWRNFSSSNAGNGGGGVLAIGDLVIRSSTFRENQASLFAGGFFGNGNVTIEDSLFVDNRSGNSAGAGVSLGANAVVVRSTFQGNRAGGGSAGLYLRGTASIQFSRFVDNVATGGGGGGVFSEIGPLQVSDSLFSRNDASPQGAAIAAFGDVSIDRTTIHDGVVSGNKPAIGVHVSGVGVIRNSIITAAEIGIAQAGTAVVTQEYNLFHGNTSNFAGTVGGGTGSLDGDPRFVDAANDDLRLAPGSAALDAGDPGFAAGGADLAGNPRVAGGRLDMGAYEMPVHAVTPSAGANGTIAPMVAQSVVEGGTAVFTVTPAAGYAASVGGTCGGTLAGATFTTNPVTASCTVVATFTQLMHTVTPIAGPNGSIAPSTPQAVAQGSAATFTITPDAGYGASVGGTCGGALVGNTYTTHAIAADCTVVASFTSNAVTIFTGPSATGSGAITASFTGGGPACTFAHARFIAVEGDAGSPPAGTAPATVSFPHGLFDFRLATCTPGATITMTVTYPGALPANTRYWKYGPTPTQPTPHWYVLPATITGNTATFSITDGGLGDDDLAADGAIVDQGGPGVGLGAVAVPTLSGWLMALLATALLACGMRRARRR